MHDSRCPTLPPWWGGTQPLIRDIHTQLQHLYGKPTMIMLFQNDVTFRIPIAPTDSPEMLFYQIEQCQEIQKNGIAILQRADHHSKCGEDINPVKLVPTEGVWHLGGNHPRVLSCIKNIHPQGVWSPPHSDGSLKHVGSEWVRKPDNLQYHGGWGWWWDQQQHGHNNHPNSCAEGSIQQHWPHKWCRHKCQGSCSNKLAVG